MQGNGNRLQVSAYNDRRPNTIDNIIGKFINISHLRIWINSNWPTKFRMQFQWRFFIRIASGLQLYAYRRSLIWPCFITSPHLDSFTAISTALIQEMTRAVHESGWLVWLNRISWQNGKSGFTLPGSTVGSNPVKIVRTGSIPFKLSLPCSWWQA